MEGTDQYQMSSKWNVKMGKNEMDTKLVKSL